MAAAGARLHAEQQVDPLEELDDLVDGLARVARLGDDGVGPELEVAVRVRVAIQVTEDAVIG
jgi:hypothetical protein